MTSRLFGEVPMPTTVHSSRGAPSLPAALTVKHMLLENFNLGRESMTENGLTWRTTTSALACFNSVQDGNPGWTRLGCLPSPLCLPHPHSPSIYSGATFPRQEPSPTGLSRQRFLPLLQLHPNYSLLPRQGHANHCYLGCITAPIPEQRRAIPLPELSCSTLPPHP